MRKLKLLPCLLLGLQSFVLFAQPGREGLSFIGVGDIMLGSSYPSEEYLPPGNDPWPLIKNVAPLFANADIVFGNLEGAFLDDGEVFKRCNDPDKCYAFKTPVSYAPALKRAGFNLINIANNHIRDFGMPGLKTTISVLDSLGISVAGVMGRPYSVLSYKGYDIGFCGFSPNTGTVQIGDIATATKIVSELKRKCDFVVVSFHGGAEGKKHQHVTRKTEMFYGEDRGNVYEFAHAVVDSGADIVFGHGPHVPRSIEIYRDRLIAYSLGNFCTYGRFNISGENGLAPVVQAWIDADGKFVKGKIHSFRQVKKLGTLPDSSGKVMEKIKMLTHTDFPMLSRRIVFNEEGEFFIPFQHLAKSREAILSPIEMPGILLVRK